MQLFLPGATCLLNYKSLGYSSGLTSSICGERHMTSEDGCAVEAHTSSMFMARWGSGSLLKSGTEEGGAGMQVEGLSAHGVDGQNPPRKLLMFACGLSHVSYLSVTVKLPETHSFRRFSPRPIGSWLSDLWAALHCGQGVWLAQTFYLTVAGKQRTGRGGLLYALQDISPVSQVRSHLLKGCHLHVMRMKPMSHQGMLAIQTRMMLLVIRTLLLS